jgi:hypothetical protein
MTHRPAFPAATAPPGSGSSGSWAALVEGAFQWLCQSRQACHPNHPVWHFRWNWNTWKPQLLAHLRAGGPGYRLSPVPRVLTAAGERLECWEPQDALILKLVSQRLEPLLLPHLSRHCHHLKGRGGVKRAVRQALRAGDESSARPPRAGAAPGEDLHRPRDAWLRLFGRGFPTWCAPRAQRGEPRPTYRENRPASRARCLTRAHRAVSTALATPPPGNPRRPGRASTLPTGPWRPHPASRRSPSPRAVVP